MYSVGDVSDGDGWYIAVELFLTLRKVSSVMGTGAGVWNFSTYQTSSGDVLKFIMDMCMKQALSLVY